MRHSEQIMKAMTEARAAIAEDTDVEAVLRGAYACISWIAPQAGGKLDTLMQALDRAAIEVGEALREAPQLHRSHRGIVRSLHSPGYPGPHPFP